MITEQPHIRLEGKGPDIAAFLRAVREALPRHASEQQQALRRALLSARRAEGVCILRVNPDHADALGPWLVEQARKHDLRAILTPPGAKRGAAAQPAPSADGEVLPAIQQQHWDDAQHRWTLRDWRVAHGAADDEGLPPRLRGAYELGVNRAGEEEITLIARTPEGHESFIRFEADNGRLKIMAYCPDQEHPQESRDEVDVFLWLTPQGAVAESGHSDQPGMRFNGNRSALLSPQAIEALGLREPSVTGRVEAPAPVGSSVPQAAMSGQSSAAYQQLVDGLRDMIEGGRLSAADIPDDYEWLVRTMANLPGGRERPPVPHGPKP